MKSEENNQENKKALSDEEIDDIVGSIDYDKIVADVKSHQDEIVANAVASAKKQTRENAPKVRNGGIVSLIIALILMIGGVLSLNAGIGLYLLIAGVLFLAMAIFLFVLARKNKNLT